MAYEFKLPDLGEGVREGEIARWLVAVGQEVAEDDPLVEIQTDKTTVEIPSPAAGKVAQILVDEGELVPVGTPLVLIGSDGEVPHLGVGVPHPRSYGTFARVLGRYVRERNTLTLEDAVHRMSGMTAARLKIFDRGLLRPGMKADIVIFDADIVIFDPDKVADKAEFNKPHQYAVGFSDVIVNGKPVIANGELTNERPGRVLYGPAKQ